MYPSSLERRILDLQMHFVFSYNANAGTVIDSLLNVKKNLQLGGFFSQSRAARTLITPL